MVMTNIWCGVCLFSLFSAILTGQGGDLAAALGAGAQAGITLGLSIAGSLALWSGVGRLMEAGGVTDGLTRLMAPVLGRLFPEGMRTPETARAISGNVCTNFLGLGNAATPMGIRAAKQLVNPAAPTKASGELCRLIVLNTASIQLLPTTVAALRSAAGSPSPFDILPCVWVSSILSVTAGLLAAKGLERWT